MDSRAQRRADHKHAWIARELKGSDNPGYFASRLFDALDEIRRYRAVLLFLAALNTAELVLRFMR